jgi:NADH-ubiquinone oxidoreductase chain 5
MTLPLFILSILSITVGFLTKDIFIGFGTDFWGAAIFVLPKNYILSDIEFIDLFHKLLPLIISLIGAFFAYFLYSFNLKKFYFIKKNRYFKIFYNFLNKKWYFDRLYNQFLAQNVISMSYKHTYQNLDRGIIEKFGPWGIVNIVISIFTELKKIQSGFVYNYLFIFFLFLFILIFLSVTISSLFFISNFLLFSILIINYKFE